MNRSGRSLCAGTATTPPASSGWSRRACPTTSSPVACAITNMASRLVALSGQGIEQVGQQAAAPPVEREQADTRIILVEVVQGLIICAVHDPKPRSHHEPPMVKRPQPRMSAIVVERGVALLGDYSEVGADLL